MLLLAALSASIVGLWTGQLEVTDSGETTTLELFVESIGSEGKLRGSLAVEKDHSPLAGTFEEAEGKISFKADFDDDALLVVALTLDGADVLTGNASLGSTRATVKLTRGAEPARFFHDSGYLLPEELPVSVVSSTLTPEQAKQVQVLLLDELGQSHAISAAMALVRDGKVVDIRCAGWEDLEGKIPASKHTRYRWASLAKPLTAVAALQLVEKDSLDLHADIRKLVPEFPDKGTPITAHQLLAHHAGILHYGNGTLIATEREYDVPHPWADRILCLDRFRESPLIAEPGARFSYTTFGYMLLGAVVERAGESTYEAQVQKRILTPLGMRTMVPDYPWVDIPHRATGYRGLRVGMATLDKKLDISWKLPGGGWVSTIDDAGRFIAGLLRGDLLDEETRELMFTSKIPADGKDSSYGYGIGTYELDGVDVVSHSGSQSAASSYFLLCPEEQWGVIVLSNTSNLSTAKIARRMFRELR